MDQQDYGNQTGFFSTDPQDNLPDGTISGSGKLETKWLYPQFEPAESTVVISGGFAIAETVTVTIRNPEHFIRHHWTKYRHDYRYLSPVGGGLSLRPRGFAGKWFWRVFGIFRPRPLAVRRLWNNDTDEE